MARCLAVLAIVIWFLLLSPYPTSVFIAAVTAALTLPVYRWLRARMSKTSAIVFFSAGLVVCVATPITIVLVMVVPQALEGARRLSAWWQAGHAIPPSISYYLGEAHRVFVENVPNAPEYLEVRGWTMEEGEMFNDRQVQSSATVCVVGKTIVRELFNGRSPLGSEIRIKNVNFRVIGVLASKGANMMGFDQDDVIIAPWTTIRQRVAGSRTSSGTISEGCIWWKTPMTPPRFWP